MTDWSTQMEPCQDPSHPLNSFEYYTGRGCIEIGCDKPAGTGWGPFWCQACNAKRLTRIGTFLQNEVDRLSGKPSGNPDSGRINYHRGQV